ncbi:PadR family transcriptional regulator [Pelagicoccus sp. SDUM812002]|uniref:PadR family transcriptional regulator n=1 Tax=Pelagicoccus sp. SDUM812002 TaxID=3041266 RepID=UPI00280C8B11|nr:PadR family transcriptional regulator [Pelagicoccus sp. SDUM812002]MDQ8186349.1 PadR family transcriptional regulator [Pelagicoccus sp. SDUM812002]
MTPSKHELMQGTLDLLILKVLSADSLHGWDVAKRIQLLSQERLLVKQGSLYPALHRLEQKAWIEAEWGISSEGRKAKFYRLTKEGSLQLTAETNRWESFVASIAMILDSREAQQ